jgi:group I intron endonuclease
MSHQEQVCGIYCIENINTHKKYIGQSKDIHKRWTNHKWYLNKNIHDNEYLQNAWNKYGEDYFTFYIVEECSIDKLDEREIYYIGYFNTYKRDCGYNLRGGGGRLADMTPEVREKLSGKNNPMYGKHHTQDAKDKISNARKDVYCGENHPRCRAIYCPELNMTFWGAKEAQELFGIQRNNICSCCSGRLKFTGKHPKTGECLHWFYLEDAIALGYDVDHQKEVV